ncbi:hypothetical protein ACHQM5_026703 [Ranunculus cassubicifolius]
MDDYDAAFFICLIAAYFVMSAAASLVQIDKGPFKNRDFERKQILERMFSESDRHCRDMLRMNRVSFSRLCERLEGKGLAPSRWVGVKEQVAMFLLIVGHDTRVRFGAFTVIRSSETLHRHFHNVLRAILKLGRNYIRQATRSCSPARSGNPHPWAMRYFKNCLGAIDGSFMPAMVPMEDQPRYRNRKGDIAHNVLATCTFDMKFTYILAGWEGSAHDTRLLRSAMTHRRDKLKVPKDKYYLGDAGFPLVPGFLVPYRGVRYHLAEQEGNTPQTAKELFNLRHSSLRNVIERSFGLLKKRFAYLRTSPFYGVDTQVNLIIACCILHNFLRCEDPEDVGSEWADPPQEGHEEVASQTSDVATLTSSSSWTAYRDNLANRMWNENN